MHFIFITRCYMPTNLAAVQKSIRSVFAGSQHTYKHVLIADLTQGGKKQDFVPYVDDDRTDLYFVSKKQVNDEHLDIALDTIFKEMDPEDAYVYFVDDDNILHPDFLKICDECDNQDVVVLRTEGRPTFGGPDAMDGNAIGHIDWVNFLAKLSVYKDVGIYHSGSTSRCEDSKFFNKMTAKGYKPKFVDKVLSYYNKLPKPGSIATNFLILTRCYKPDNLEAVKKSIQEVFVDSQHGYRHLILADLTHGTDREAFERFADDKTGIFYVESKNDNDSQITEGMDNALATVKPVSENEYVYVLDDDNILHPAFLHVAEYCKGEDAVVFKIEGRPDLGNKDILSMYPVGHIDWANYVTKLTTMQRIKVYHLDGPRRCEDGVFFDHMKRENCTFAFADRVMAYYNKLR